MGRHFVIACSVSNRVLSLRLTNVHHHALRQCPGGAEEGGFWRRLYPIPFEVEIPDNEQEKGLKNYFMTDPDAKTAILAEILEGATEWYQLSDGGRINGRQGSKETVLLQGRTESYRRVFEKRVSDM